MRRDLYYLEVEKILSIVHDPMKPSDFFSGADLELIEKQQDSLWVILYNFFVLINCL